MKDTIIKIAVFGACFGFMFALIGLGALWYVSRPHPPSAWDTTAITAKFADLRVYEDKRIRFSYNLTNNTDYDYDLTDGKSDINTRVNEDKVLSRTGHELIHIIDGCFIPSHQTALLTFQIPYEVPPWTYYQVQDTTRNARISILKDYINKHLRNLYGFTILDRERRYQVELPKEW